MPAERDAELEEETAGEPDAPPQPPLSRVRLFKRAAKIVLLLFAVIIVWLERARPHHPLVRRRADRAARRHHR